MYVALYLMLGVAFTGGLFWALAQITARQGRLNAEMTRLERLSAEVSMSAEAILDLVDERMEQLNAMLSVVEQKAEARSDDSVAALVTPTVLPPTPTVNEAASPTPPPPQNYQDLRTAVWVLAGQGKTAADIAQALNIPRGEVQLMLNLQTGRVTA